MRKRIIVGLAILNGLFALALFAVPAETQIIPFGIRDCCENAGTPQGFCCFNCCWFINDCETDAECRDK